MQSINSFKRFVNSHSVSDSVKCWTRREAFLIEQKWLFLVLVAALSTNNSICFSNVLFLGLCVEKGFFFFFSKAKEDFGATDPSTMSTVKT